MKRIRRIRWVLLGIVAAGVVLAFAWPRPKLVWYTTPILHVGTRRVRVTLLVPYGWRYEAERSDLQGRYSQCWLMAGYAYGWAPGFLRRLLPTDKKSIGAVIFNGSERPPRPYKHGFSVTGDPYGGWMASKQLIPAANFIATYDRFDKREFDSTYREILNSVKVEEVRE